MARAPVGGSVLQQSSAQTLVWLRRRVLASLFTAWRAMVMAETIAVLEREASDLRTRLGSRGDEETSIWTMSKDKLVRLAMF